MADLQCFSFSVGMTPEAQLALIRGERGPLGAAPPESVEVQPEPPAADPAPPMPSKRRRAQASAAASVEREN